MLAGCAFDLACRQVVRQSPIERVVGYAVSAGVVVAIAGLAVLAAAAWSWWRGTLSVSRTMALVLAFSLPAGLALQQEFGARLGSDGFFYYAFLRSIVNDGDVNLSNDYVLLGLSGEIVTSRTATGHAPTAWSIGPAIAWIPFYPLGHLGARHLAASGQPVATDGSSFPYRQAICVAGLCYGLLGFWWCFRFGAVFVRDGVAALATVGIALGSFMTWYLVKEPTMSHATSMCVVAAFLLVWARTREDRAVWQWAVLGVLGGFMAATRWQNALFLAFPAWDAVTGLAPGGERRRRQHALRGPAVFACASVAGFAPQLIAWNAIYGSPLAVSPDSPELYWTRPDIVRVLWSSRNGLFSFSPIAYVGAIGLVIAAVRGRAPDWLSLAVFLASVWVNASVQDWWGGTAYGARRFDGTLPLLVLGLAAAIDAAAAWVARRPMVPVAVLVGSLVLWNLTAMGAAMAGAFGGSMPQSFAALAAEQARLLHRWFGYPFSYPANLLFAAREGVAPSRYDDLAFPMLEDPSRPYGRIDLGERDESYVGDGWYGAESARDGRSFRWTAARGELLLPLHHATRLTVQAQVRPFTYAGSLPILIVRINGHGFGPFPLTPDWQRVEFATEASTWKTGVNRVELVWPGAGSPVRLKMGNDPRELGGMVDYFRIAVLP